MWMGDFFEFLIDHFSQINNKINTRFEYEKILKCETISNPTPGAARLRAKHGQGGIKSNKNIVPKNLFIPGFNSAKYFSETAWYFKSLHAPHSQEYNQSQWCTNLETRWLWLSSSITMYTPFGKPEISICVLFIPGFAMTDSLRQDIPSVLRICSL